MRDCSACSAVGTLRLMTHLACAENAGGLETKLQLERFRALSAPLRLERSIANSAGIIAWPEAHAEWVRPGLMLYGASPFAERSAADLGLLPAMTFTTQLIAVRNVAAGEAIGYNGIWRAKRRRASRVAAVGYGDGYPRCMRAGAPVLINGREAPVVGRVSMDMTMLDVTDLPDAAVGDEVTLWGKGLPAERVAPFADTIAYELFCRIAERVKRVRVGLKPDITESSCPTLAFEESHLHAGQQDHIVVLQLAGLLADAAAVDQRIVVRLAAVDVHDEEAIGAARDRRDLHARAAERRQRFVQLELAARERAAQHLQLRFRQRDRMLAGGARARRHRADRRRRRTRGLRCAAAEAVQLPTLSSPRRQRLPSPA